LLTTDPTTRSRTRLVLSVLSLAALLWCAHAWITIVRPERALFSFDSAEYALAGRELARTGVLATPFSYVGALRSGAHPPFPLLAGHPLLPLLEAPVFAVFGPHSWGSLVPVAVCYLLTVALIALLAMETGASATVAAVAALAAAPAMLNFAVDGLSELPFTAAWTGALVLLAAFRRAPRAFGLGVLLGLAHLARPVVVPTLPAWLLAAAWSAPRGERLRHAAWVFAGFAPLAGALLLYKWMATGSPLTDLGGIMLLTGLRPEFGQFDVARMLHPPDALDLIRAHPEALMRKLSGSVPFMVRQALQIGGRAAGIAFVLYLVRPRRDGAGPVRLVMGFSLAAIVGLAALTLPRSHFLFPLLPAAVALGAGELERLGRAARFPRGVSVVVVAGLLFWSPLRSLAAEWGGRWNSSRPPDAFRESDLVGFGRAVAARIPPGTWVASDLAPWLSWYADRTSVNIPIATADLAELRTRHGLGAVVLTNEWLVWRPGNEAWRAAFEGRVPPAGWHLGDTLTFGRLRARFMYPE
jgi:hypothetical protein